MRSQSSYHAVTFSAHHVFPTGSDLGLRHSKILVLCADKSFFAEDEVASQLPCGDTFGDACISSWLAPYHAATTSTCPVCRYEVIGDGLQTIDHLLTSEEPPIAPHPMNRFEVLLNSSPPNLRTSIEALYGPSGPVHQFDVLWNYLISDPKSRHLPRDRQSLESFLLPVGAY